MYDSGNPWTRAETSKGTERERGFLGRDVGRVGRGMGVSDFPPCSCGLFSMARFELAGTAL